MKKIIIDAYGGDNAPLEIIKGVAAASLLIKNYNLVLVGKVAEMTAILETLEYDKNIIELINADSAISNEESPTEAIRKKTDSSIVVGLNALNSNQENVAFVSCGSTGAVLTGAVLLCKRLNGISRPGLCPVLPTVTNKSVVLIDCGANVDPKPINLVQFAKLANGYCKAMGIDNPKIALLSNGAEDNKGNELNKEVFPLLKDSGLNFVGNIEAREVLSGNVDVVVADGFSGNICLKASEGVALSLFDLIKQAIMAGGIRAKLGYILLKPALKLVKNKMDYNNNGGALFLGLNKIIIKSHGSSKAKAVTASIIQAKELADADLIKKIADSL